MKAIVVYSSFFILVDAFIRFLLCSVLGCSDVFGFKIACAHAHAFMCVCVCCVRLYECLLYFSAPLCMLTCECVCVCLSVHVSIHLSVCIHLLFLCIIQEDQICQDQWISKFTILFNSCEKTNPTTECVLVFYLCTQIWCNVLLVCNYIIQSCDISFFVHCKLISLQIACFYARWIVYLNSSLKPRGQNARS